MKKTPKIQAGVSIALVLTLALVMFSCAGKEVMADTAAPALAVSGSGVPGKVMDVTGTGFVPGEVIELVLNMEDVPIIVGKKGKVIQAKEDGSFSATTNYPHKYVAIPGVWDLEANGDKGTKAVCKVEIKKP